MKTMRLGYLVPQFPGQTHIFFWREIRHLERLGVRVSILSTRPPPRRLMAHSWTAEAMARTTYLGAPRAGGTLRRLPGLPFWDADVRGGGGRLALSSSPAPIRRSGSSKSARRRESPTSTFIPAGGRR